MSIGTFTALAAEVDADRVLCAPNLVMSMPASASVVFNHRLIVSADTSLYGLWKLMKSFDPLVTFLCGGHTQQHA